MSSMQKQFLPPGGGHPIESIHQIPLNCLKPGAAARISQIALTDTMRRRLQDMGLIPGAAVECVSISPLGDPAAYLIKGAVIALRRADACLITVNLGAPEELAEVCPEAAPAAAWVGCEG